MYTFIKVIIKNDGMLPAHVKLRDIDSHIRDLVIEMNKLPFIDTISSCSSYLDNRGHGRRRVQITGNSHLSEGWLSFQVDDRYLLVPEFVERLEQEVGAYPFALFDQRESGYRLPPPNSPYHDELSRATAEEIERYSQDFGRYSSHDFSIMTASADLSYGNLQAARIRLRQIYGMWGHLTDTCRGFQTRADLVAMLH